MVAVKLSTSLLNYTTGKPWFCIFLKLVSSNRILVEILNVTRICITREIYTPYTGGAGMLLHIYTYVMFGLRF